MPDFDRLYLSAERCSAVYIPDEATARVAFDNLGSTVLGRYANDEHQAIAHLAVDGTPTLTISGTRVSEGTWADHFGDLWEDIDCRPLDLGDGICVATGAHQGLDKLWAWALGVLPTVAKIDVEGHSLGGWRASYTPLFLAPERIGRLTAIEPPKPANDAYWAKYSAELMGLVTICHGRDPWFHWPWEGWGLRHKPGQSVLWLHDQTWAQVSADELPDGDLFASADHGPASVVAALKALMEASAK